MEVSTLLLGFLHRRATADLGSDIYYGQYRQRGQKLPAGCRTDGYAISYGFGQGATLVAAFWGVFIWREFRTAPAGTNKFLTMIFLFYIVRLTLIIAGNKTAFSG